MSQPKTDIVTFIKDARETLKNLEDLAKIIDGPLLNTRSKGAVYLQIAGVVEEQISDYLALYDDLHCHYRSPSHIDKEPTRRIEDSTTHPAGTITTPNNIATKRR